VSLNTAGQAGFDATSIPLGDYHFGLKGEGYLKKIIRDLPVATSDDIENLEFTILLGGEITGDDAVNALDIAKNIGLYYTDDFITDQNRDGVVNAPDIAIILANYLKTGDTY